MASPTGLGGRCIRERTVSRHGSPQPVIRPPRSGSGVRSRWDPAGLRGPCIRRRRRLGTRPPPMRCERGPEIYIATTEGRVSARPPTRRPAPVRAVRRCSATGAAAIDGETDAAHPQWRVSRSGDGRRTVSAEASPCGFGIGFGSGFGNGDRIGLHGLVCRHQLRYRWICADSDAGDIDASPPVVS